ncbi:MAG: zeta toxin family protein [Campylobacterota bacterium]|nr:zeta toxin family protein [Campylobacterota bacterium]
MKKKLYIIAGANGSGKTTFAKSFAQINNLYFINADEIAKELDPDNITKHQVKAGRIFFQELNNRLEGKKSFVVETTLSGKYLVRYIKKAQSNGFEVEMIYLFLEKPETNIGRVAVRVVAGGHDVPKSDIIRRFYRSQKMFFEIYKDIVDDWTVYYNSNESFDKVADANNIYNHEKMNKFRRIEND